MPSIRRVRAVAAALLILALGALGAPAGAASRWTMPSEYPANAMPGEAMAIFARELAVGTGGTLVVEPKPDSGTALTSARIADEVAGGRLPAGDVFGGALGTRDPLFELSALPFAVASLAEARQLADRARPAYAQALERQGLHLAYLVPWPPSGIWSKAPLARPEDVKGLAIRTYDEASGRVLAAAGAKAEAISFAAVAARLKDGSLTAVLSSGDGGAGLRLWETLPYFTAVNYAFPLSFGLVNAKLYAELPEAERVALDMAGAEAERAAWSLVETRVAANYAVMRQNGVTIAAEPPAAIAAMLSDAAKGVIDAWRPRSADGAALLDGKTP